MNTSVFVEEEYPSIIARDRLSGFAVMLRVTTLILNLLIDCEDLKRDAKGRLRSIRRGAGIRVGIPREIVGSSDLSTESLSRLG